MTEIRVPTLGESITEATIGKWFKKAGDPVAVDEQLVDLAAQVLELDVHQPEGLGERRAIATVLLKRRLGPGSLRVVDEIRRETVKNRREVALGHDLDELRAQIRVVKRRLWDQHVADWKKSDTDAAAKGNGGVLMKAGQWQR